MYRQRDFWRAGDIGQTAGDQFAEEFVRILRHPGPRTVAPPSRPSRAFANSHSIQASRGNNSVETSALRNQGRNRVDELRWAKLALMIMQESSHSDLVRCDGTVIQYDSTFS
ncbi:hypothetical protein FRC10_005354 [Ceratobasidium sp. 414]|nr:hypothetical protein FRC10_005354 [Ceratobasidium sp. 414]